MMSTFEELFDDALDVFADVVEAASVSVIEKAIEARACGDGNLVSAVGETVAKVFEVDLDEVCGDSSEEDEPEGEMDESGLVKAAPLSVENDRVDQDEDVREE